MKSDIRIFFETLRRKFKFLQNLTRITVTLHEDRYTFLIIILSVLLRMRNFSDKYCRENQNTHFLPFMRCVKDLRAEEGTDDSMAHAHLTLDT
jgi:hypothetical protein